MPKTTEDLTIFFLLCYRSEEYYNIQQNEMSILSVFISAAQFVT